MTQPTRPLPHVTFMNDWFWTSGADGQLRIQGCGDCGHLVHPPVQICLACRSRAWSPTVMSGRATVVATGGITPGGVLLLRRD
jgi:uncharacterized OB-fold protein